MTNGNPTVEICCCVRISEVVSNGLIFIDRRIFVAQKHPIGLDMGAKPHPSQLPVESPARVFLPEQDHQKRRHIQACTETESRRHG